MGIYAVTGGSSGIGEQAVKILRSFGHEVINIDISNGNITADLGTVDGRELVISKVHERCPDGLDGFICRWLVCRLSYAQSYGKIPKEKVSITTKDFLNTGQILSGKDISRHIF